jgi:hypothetical protein
MELTEEQRAILRHQADLLKTFQVSFPAGKQVIGKYFAWDTPTEPSSFRCCAVGAITIQELYQTGEIGEEDVKQLQLQRARKNSEDLRFKIAMTATAVDVSPEWRRAKEMVIQLNDRAEKTFTEIATILQAIADLQPQDETLSFTPEMLNSMLTQ